MPNTSIPATAEGMPEATRRRFLQMLPAAAAIAAIPIPAPAAPIDPMEAARYHADQLAAAMNEINSERRFRVAFDTENTFVVICGDRKDRSDRATPAVYDGPNFYEISLRTESGRYGGLIASSTEPRQAITTWLNSAGSGASNPSRGD
ncbi:hypothetical protein AJ87_03130 [Rhizobium yanglingense]|nr:hypothetical protein AJ87_03130 [Rhizobium yanglingense]